eukprot:7144911-Pyramimonas_sp.AAC.1
MKTEGKLGVNQARAILPSKECMIRRSKIRQTHASKFRGRRPEGGTTYGRGWRSPVTERLGIRLG